MKKGTTERLTFSISGFMQMVRLCLNWIRNKKAKKKKKRNKKVSCHSRAQASTDSLWLSLLFSSSAICDYDCVNGLLFVFVACEYTSLPDIRAVLAATEHYYNIVQISAVLTFHLRIYVYFLFYSTIKDGDRKRRRRGWGDPVTLSC